MNGPGPDFDENIRQPPVSIEAEQAVLGGLMLNERAWINVMDVLTEGDFFRNEHRIIWRAIKELADKNRPFDAVTMGEYFEAHGLRDQVRSSYLIELSSTTPSAANIRAYADIVADKAQLRGLIEAGQGLIDDAFKPEGRKAVEIMGTAQTRIGKMLQSQPCDLEAVKPIMMRVFERMQERYERGGQIAGIASGIDDLDELINGLGDGQLIILAARPKMGKTTLAQNIAEHVAIKVAKPVAVFSFEMQPEELGDRMLSSLGNVDGDRIRRGDLEDADWSGINEAIRKLSNAKIFISRPRSARVEHVVAQVRRQHARTPLGLVVIDYLQLMQVAGDNRAQGYGDVTRALKLMAGELRIPVILLSQLNRDLEKRVDKRPMLSDLRDSGAIEQDADIVVFIYRDEIYHRDSRDKGSAELIVAAQRNGRTDTVRVQYRPDRFRFENLPDGWEPTPRPPSDKPTRKGWKKGGKEAAAGADD